MQGRQLLRGEHRHREQAWDAAPEGLVLCKIGWLLGLVSRIAPFRPERLPTPLRSDVVPHLFGFT
jgi:hypothetical protein